MLIVVTNSSFKLHAVVSVFLKIIATIVGLYLIIIGLFGAVAGAGIAGELHGIERLWALVYLLVGIGFVIPNKYLNQGAYKIYYLFVFSSLPIGLLMFSVMSGFAVGADIGQVYIDILIVTLSLSPVLSLVLYQRPNK